MPNNMSNLDGNQVLRSAYDDSDNALRTFNLGALVPESYDEIILTYIVSGNGAGEISTVVYKNATVTIATLTLSYDSSDRLISTVRS